MQANDHRRSFTRSELARQLQDLGVKRGGTLLVHTSFRAVRPVEDGPAGLIEALRLALGPEGTLVMPSWTGDPDTAFYPTETAADADLGVVADLFWRMPEVRRSDHPIAFAAWRPRAEEIVGGDLPIPPHGLASPVARVHDRDGQVLLLGCQHDADTTIHLAEVLAGVPYGVPHHCTIRRGAEFVRVDFRENDHCCARFRLVDAWLRARGLQTEGPVGHAPARLARSRDIVGVALGRLKRDPLIFLHPPGADCAECAAARASIA